MRNRDDKGMTNIGSSHSESEVKESSRRPDNSYDSSTGRTGSSSGSVSNKNKNSGSDRLRDENDISRDDFGRRGGSGSMGSSSEGGE